MRIGRKFGFALVFLFAAGLIAACGGGDDAAAPPLPAVTTGAATSGSNVTATLNGTVNPNGAATDAWFEWGTDNTLAANTATTIASVGSGTAAVAVTDNLVGLTASTTYYYRIAASSPRGTSRGAILSFTTADLNSPIVVTGAATSSFADNATLNGTVNPNGLATTAWFEYGTDNTLATFTATDNTVMGSGTAAVALTDDIVGLTAATEYFYRVAAANADGTSKGSILSVTTAASNPPPVASAGPDQSVSMRGASGATSVALDASGSTDLFGTITGYAWTQLSGTAVTLTGDTTATPTFTAPQIPYGAPSEFVFQVEITDDRGLTSTDNVAVTVNWGFLEDFSVDTRATYTIVDNPNPNPGDFVVADNVGLVTTGTNNQIFFSHLFSLGANTNPDASGRFSIDYHPTTSYDATGGIVVSVGDDANTYYRVSTLTGENFVEKWRAGAVVADSGAATAGAIAQGQTYPIVISFTRSVTTVEAFGQTITLGGGDNPVPMAFFSVLTQEKDAFFDNAKLEILP